jgi:hypothetical protein
MIAIVVIEIADKAGTILSGFTKESRGPLMKKISSTASMKTLKILLPKMLPIARFIEPILIAYKDTIASGNVVEIAIKIFPTNV